MRVALFTLAVLTMPAAAQNNPPLAGTPCLQLPNIASYRVLPGGRSLAITDKQGRQIRVGFPEVCDSLQVHPNLGFKTFSTSPYACVGRGDSIYSSNDVGAQRLCRIQSIDWFNPPPPDGGHARG